MSGFTVFLSVCGIILSLKILREIEGEEKLELINSGNCNSGNNKANEWHYVKDELPISDKDKYYFVVDKWNEPMIARFYEGVWSNYSTIENVIAWKEIVLPELPKEIKENEETK